MFLQGFLQDVTELVDSTGKAGFGTRLVDVAVI